MPLPGVLSRALRHLRADELPVQRAVLSCLLGMIITKDLLTYDVARSLLWMPGSLRLPWFRFAAPIAWTPRADAIAFVVLIIAFVAAASMMVGRFVRLAALFLGLLYACYFFSDQLLYTNNVYLLVLLLGLTALEPIDPARPSGVYARRAIQGLISLVYFVGVMSKLGHAWCSGRVLEQALLHYDSMYTSLHGPTDPRVFAILAFFVIAMEAFLAVFLWTKRFRRMAIVVGVLLHLGVEVLLPVRTFSFLMIASYAAFLEAGDLAWFLRFREGPRMRQALVALVVVVAFALSFDLAIAWHLHDAEQLPRRKAAFIVGAIVAWAIVMRRPTKTRAACSPRPRPSLRLPLLAVFAALQSFGVTKPWLGYSNRFAWRMFTEVLTMKVAVEVRRENEWETADVPSRVWKPLTESETSRYHWDSLSEERLLLEAWADQLIARPELRGVRVIADYERDGVPGRLIIERKRTAGPGPDDDRPL